MSVPESSFRCHSHVSIPFFLVACSGVGQDSSRVQSVLIMDLLEEALFIHVGEHDLLTSVLLASRKTDARQI